MKAPNLQAPVVQRWRVRYTKRGRMRFASHRDFSRALERAVRRAEIPVAFSSGFSPHPRISYTNAAPTGVASEAEYLEIALQEQIEPDQLVRDLNDALPEGLDIVDIAPALTPDFSDRLQASSWEIEVLDQRVDTVQTAISTLMDAPEVMVERVTKQGLRRFDARGPIFALSASQGQGVRPGSVILKAVIRHVTPAVRPDDLLAALHVAAGLGPLVAVVTRMAQGPLDEESGVIGDPLALDRSA